MIPDYCTLRRHHSRDAHRAYCRPAIDAARPYWTVRAYRSWSDVERGRVAHDTRHDDAAEARAVYDALDLPIADIIRHDPALDGRGGGRVTDGRRAPYPE
ncbi:MAG: hypothetical protein MUE61_08315 [Vicinamibacterales bacterium]|jgi:hypothetical protein|nr:hypothetical protein [Vicinamibacterales bacterium]MCU0477169.1 hypothetical protein [Chloroflexota bacterium]MCU0562313.1 hypothetical protein [Desulfobacterales bacterium]